MNGGNKDQKTWYIGKVVSAKDPDKRQRLQIRRPTVSQEDIADDKLTWLPKFPSEQDSFALPEAGQPVLVLMFDDMHFWLPMPNKAAWQDFGDDYERSWLATHKDVLEAKFTDAAGFSFTLNGNVAVKTGNTSILVTKDSIKLDFKDLHIDSDGSSYTMKVKDVTLSTDGSRVSVSNGQQSLASILDNMMQTLQQHVHPTPAGPSGPPASKLADLKKQQAAYKQLLK